ncbi:exonuclease SbcCD subunit D [Caldicellulosiruptoraceae bacterium PP1]
MLKIVHTADLHFGVTTYSKETPDGLGSRVLDYFKTFTQIKDFIYENNVDILLITGDIFKDREPNSTLRNKFYKEVLELSQRGVICIIIPGNHDMHPFEIKDHNIKTLQIFDLENVYIMDKNFQELIIEKNNQKVRFISIPYPYPERILTLLDKKNISEEEMSLFFSNYIEQKINNMLESSPDIPTIIGAHLTMSEATVGSERGIMLGRDIKVSLSAFLNPKISYVALGHIHKPQILNAKEPLISYCGSPDILDFSEISDKKGFMYLEINENKLIYSFINTKVRPFFEIKINLTEFDENENYEEKVFLNIDRFINKVEKEGINFKSSIVRVLIYTTNIIKKNLDFKKIQEYIEKKCFYLSAINIEVIDNKKDFRIVDIDESTNPSEAFKKYLNSHLKYKDLKNKDQIIEKFNQLFMKNNNSLS